ncbi:hypothetical protein ZYGR_0AG03000 [Zygosaccharomyces rouxii]|uniref:Cytosolic endo-beta-N-acetylglucosaminidase TIM barrel domain-containing protein n=1 Tax=Zygosaccharomyces rouxii TaxID=4956 RepID=A0A1Q3A977_ZYGRO|nr:hypothetical protein ZYGR_0AG03000 [Zygosaccharomyces rouxii]
MKVSYQVSGKPGITSLYFDNLRSLQRWFDKGFMDLRDLSNVPKEKYSSYLKFRKDGLTKIPSLVPRKTEITVCHDFKGGYQSGHDLYTDGQYGIESCTPYSLRYPEVVDKFIYFSHHCITIPPAPWTNYLHRHSIPVLGTLIFEHYSQTGELFRKTKKDEFLYVKLLVELCRIFHFEGWLINFETGFSNNAHQVIPFLKELTARVECEIHGGIVMWYDAFTTFANNPSHQNEVNIFNYDAYENSSQFMTNYMWNSHNVGNSLRNVGSLGMHSHVALGVDVWGRSMQVCRGGFESDLAIYYAKKFGTNAVLFAPGWTYEKFGEDQFYEKDDKFWGNIKSTLQLDSYPESQLSSWYVSESKKSRFFTTFFSTGSGNFFNLNGRRISNENWVQLGLSTPLPIHSRSHLNFKDSFVGGSCLAVPLSPMENGLLHLFKFEQFINDKQKTSDSEMRVKFSYKSLGALPPVKLVIKCFVVRRGKRSKTILKVDDVSLVLPLMHTKCQTEQGLTKWALAEQSVPLPSLESRFLEEYYVEGAHLEWTVDNNQDEWMMVPERTEDLDCKLLIGSLCLEIGPHEDPSTMQIIRNGSEISWQDKESSFMWLKLQDGRLNSVLFAPTTEINDMQLTILECGRNGDLKFVVKN